MLKRGIVCLLASLVLIVAAVPLAQSEGVAATGHEIGNARTKIEACSSALESAELSTAAVATYGTKSVNIQGCQCEENKSVDENSYKRWTCIVRWAVTDLGRSS